MADPNPQQRAGLNVNLGSGQGTAELQGILVQLGRVADLLQELVKEYKAANANPVRPQPFSGNVG